MKSPHALHQPDALLIALVCMLLGAGLIALSSASAETSMRVFGTSYGFVEHQLLFGILPGLAGMAFFYFIPHTTVRSFALPFFLGSIFLLILAFVPAFSYSAGGAQRWVQFGELSIQPAELTKLSFIIYIAAWLAGRKKQVVSTAEGLLPFLGLLGILAVFLILQPDISTLGIIAIIACAMYFAAGARLLHMVAIALLGVGALAILVWSAPYRMERVMTFLNPGSDPQGASFQTQQALVAVGSGGTWGMGLGASNQNSILPEPVGDSIFAIWGEETGFAGSLFLVALFLLFAWRGFLIARATSDRFAHVAAVGIVVWISVQAYINIASTVGVIQLSGIPLPFMSYGGSAMAANLSACGLLFHISRYAKFS